MKLRMNMGRKEMRAKDAVTGLRFCQLCGSYVGNMTTKAWDYEGRMCRKCGEAFGSSLELHINMLDERHFSWELSQEKSRISRLN